jgi:hypothetical protein
MIGQFTVELAVIKAAATELRWIRPDGRHQKSAPAEAQKEHAEDIKELKSAAKDIERMLPAQRDRMDGLFLERKSWPSRTWCERYLNHPLVGTLARRIIWSFRSGDRTVSAIYWSGDLVGHDDKPIGSVSDAATVELWHPIGRPIDETLAWREWLERHEVRQPFKQAHRELYLVTDAELATHVYSNRYAAHILKQHQFNALCAVRGWKNKLRLMVDLFEGDNTLSIILSKAFILAEDTKITDPAILSQIQRR